MFTLIFQYKKLSHDFLINHLDPENTCVLKSITEPLELVTQELKNQIATQKDYASKLEFKNGIWEITLSHSLIYSKNVILATGCEPKTLDYSGVSTIPLAMALDPFKLLAQVSSSDKIAVFGSSHSAILALMNLMQTEVKTIFNFYRSPLRYATYFEDWILFDDSGLKGKTAQWARENISASLPDKLTRVYASDENIKRYLPDCTKVIYAIGFDRRPLPAILPSPNLNYTERCGILSPGLFGFGFAFPEAKVNPLGILEYRVGLWKFMDYLERVLPIWLKYRI